MNKKIFNVVVMTMMMVMLFANIVFAGGYSVGTNPFGNPEPNGAGLSAPVGSVIGFLVFAAWAVAIGMMIFFGIKYMTAGAGQKAEVKSTFLPYVVGAVCVGAATTIVNFVMNLGH